MSCAIVASPPRAHGPAVISARSRVEPEDFDVTETLAFEPSGDGEHLFVEIEKRLENTEQVARQLADAFGVAPVDVSYAGRKDRRAVTRQWFSVRTPRDEVPALRPSCRLLRRTRHVRKLRRGELAHNAFRIRLRDVAGDAEALAARLAAIRTNGFPNYFGPQRFGRDGANVARAFAFLTARPRRRTDAATKGLHLSVGRALLFNAVLAARVEGAVWNAVVPGDVCLEGEAPTGPLWGRGRAPVRADAARIEADALVPFAAWRDALEHAGLVQARRALVTHPDALVWAHEGDELVLEFRLGPGSYASVLLAELGSMARVEDTRVPDADVHGEAG